MKLNRRHSKKNEKGQAAIEFIVVAVVLFFFLLFFLSVSVLIIVSEYIDYATFMAARTYKSGASGEARQRENAQTVFNDYMRGFDSLARNVQLSFDVRTDPDSPQTAGVTASYDVDLFYLPPVFVSGNNPSRIRLTTEAHLGRDPSFNECQGFFTDFLQRNGIGASIDELAQRMEDNGC